MRERIFTSGWVDCFFFPRALVFSILASNRLVSLPLELELEGFYMPFSSLASFSSSFRCWTMGYLFTVDVFTMKQRRIWNTQSMLFFSNLLLFFLCCSLVGCFWACSLFFDGMVEHKGCFGVVFGWSGVMGWGYL